MLNRPKGGRVKGRVLAKQTIEHLHRSLGELICRARYGGSPVKVGLLVEKVLNFYEDEQKGWGRLQAEEKRLGEYRISRALQAWFNVEVYDCAPDDVLPAARCSNYHDREVYAYYRALVARERNNAKRWKELRAEAGALVLNAILERDDKVLCHLARMVELSPALRPVDLRQFLLLLVSGGGWDKPIQPRPHLTLAKIVNLVKQGFPHRNVDRTQIRRILEDEFGVFLPRAKHGRRPRSRPP